MNLPMNTLYYLAGALGFGAVALLLVGIGKIQWRWLRLTIWYGGGVGLLVVAAFITLFIAAEEDRWRDIESDNLYSNSQINSPTDRIFQYADNKLSTLPKDKIVYNENTEQLAILVAGKQITVSKWKDKKIIIYCEGTFYFPMNMTEIEIVDVLNKKTVCLEINGKYYKYMSSFRVDFPQYNDLSDRDLAERLRKKYRPEMSELDFNKAFKVH